MIDKVSVIVPVYNGEKYIKKCLNDLMNQTYKNYEVIIIDDGSTDNTSEICKLICEKDSRFKYFYQKNSGVSAARNLGIDLSEGQYIAFADADDTVSIYLLEYLYKGIKEFDATISICSCEKTSERDKPFYNKEPHYVIMKNDTLLEELYDEDDMKFWSVCGKMYASYLFDKIRFENGRMYEDVDIVYRLLFEANKVINCKEVYYYYYSNLDSATKKSYSLKRTDQLWAMERLIDFLKYQKMDTLYRKILNQYLYLISYHYNEIKKNQLSKKYLRELKNKMRLNMKYNKNLIDFSIKKTPYCYEVLYPSIMSFYWIIIGIRSKIKKVIQH